ncbi:MAG: hypothetical protein GWO20_04510, partial [Candidatus Korarchaeota archaeon]|nr:hypothetical protein [Candidatus Korarchaeota archaeon]
SGDGESKDYLPAMVFFRIVDVVAPSVTIDLPGDDAIVYSTTVTVEWTGSDDIDISYYEIRIDGGTWTNVGENNSYEFTGLVGGNHTVTVKVVDGAGNTASDT